MKVAAKLHKKRNRPGRSSPGSHLYQLHMILYRLFNPLWLDADIALGGGGGAVLQQALDKGDIITIILVNLRGIPLTEAVGADTLIAQVIAYNGKLLLNGALCDRKDNVGAPDAVAEAIVLNILLNEHRYGEDPAFPGFLFHYI